MSDIFEDPDAVYLVLINAEGQHCLWPASKGIPAEWDAVHGPANRGECLDYVNTHWTDLRSRSLVAYLESRNGVIA